MRTFALLVVIWGCVPPADQRDLSYTSAPRVSYTPEIISHIDTTEVSAMRAKVKNLRAETESMRAEVDALSLRLSDK